MYVCMYGSAVEFMVTAVSGAYEQLPGTAAGAIEIQVRTGSIRGNCTDRCDTIKRTCIWYRNKVPHSTKELFYKLGSRSAHITYVRAISKFITTVMARVAAWTPIWGSVSVPHTHTHIHMYTHARAHKRLTFLLGRLWPRSRGTTDDMRMHRGGAGL